MFGMGGGMDMGSMMMGGSAGPSLATIGGVIIEAHTIAAYGNNFGRDPKLAAEPKYPFEVPEKSEPEENTEVALDEEGNEVTVPKDESHLDQSGDLLFVRNLKKSQLFSNEDEFTTTVTRQKSVYLENGADFEIQLKFNVVLEAYPWNEVKEGGMGGGMGAAMGAGPMD